MRGRGVGRIRGEGLRGRRGLWELLDLSTRENAGKTGVFCGCFAGFTFRVPFLYAGDKTVACFFSEIAYVEVENGKGENDKAEVEGDRCWVFCWIYFFFTAGTVREG